MEELFVSAAHAAALQAMDPGGGLVRQVAAMRVGYAAAVEACARAAATVGAPEAHRAWHWMRGLRALRCFSVAARRWVREELVGVRDAARHWGDHDMPKSVRKALRAAAKRALLVLDVTRVTCACAVEAMGGGSPTVEALAADEDDVDALVQDTLLALHHSGLSAADATLREHYTCGHYVHSSTQHAMVGADTFVAPGHAAHMLLDLLARHAMPCGVQPYAHVALDTPSLDDYRAVCAGVGTTVSCLWWTGTAPRPAALCVDRFVLDTSLATVRQRVVLPGTPEALQRLTEPTADHEDELLTRDASFAHDERLALDDIAVHLAQGHRAPVAAFTSTRYTFVAPRAEVVVTLDCGVSFLALSGDWAAFRRALLGANDGEYIRYPHCVLSLQVMSHAPSWVKKLFRDPKVLHYAPRFSLHQASVAVGYGHTAYAVGLQNDAALARARLAELKRDEAQQRKAQRGKLMPLDIGYNLEEMREGRVLFMGNESRGDPKTYLTNERTAFSWMETATFLAFNALSLFAVDSQATRVGGLMSMIAAFSFAAYALFRWQWRQRALRQGRQLGPFVDRVGPVLAVAIMGTMLVGQVVVSNLLGTVIGQ